MRAGVAVTDREPLGEKAVATTDVKDIVVVVFGGDSGQPAW